MLSARLFLLQRITAAILAPLVIGHLVLIIYAVRGGVDATEILARTQGSVLCMVYYGTFVIAASIHASLGVRVLLREYFDLKSTTLTWSAWLVMLVGLVLGLRAVYAVTM